MTRDAAKAADNDGHPSAAGLLHRSIELFTELLRITRSPDRRDACRLALIDLSWSLWNNTIGVYSLAGAVAWAQELVHWNPRSGPDWSRLALLYRRTGAWEAARSAAETALTFDAQALGTWNLLGTSCLALGDVASGRACFEQVKVIGGDSNADQRLRLWAYMLTGEYGAGWRERGRQDDELLAGRYEGRLLPELRPLVGQQQWTGEPMPGRLLLLLEDGHGDGFMMARWVPQVVARVGSLCVQARAELVPLLRDQWPGVEVIRWNASPGPYDRCVLSNSLPRIFGVERPEDVRSVPYLRSSAPPPALAGTVRVGLRWAGEPVHVEDVHRSTRLADWGAVLDVPGVTFYSLQLGRGAEQVDQTSTPIMDLAPGLTDWARTAAAMMALDLIISVDTSCAHLAGALGRPVWICLPAAPEWRWMLERTDCPWYGSARLFRQRRIGEWPALFAEVAAALEREVQERGRLSA